MFVISNENTTPYYNDNISVHIHHNNFPVIITTSICGLSLLELTDNRIIRFLLIFLIDIKKFAINIYHIFGKKKKNK